MLHNHIDKLSLSWVSRKTALKLKITQECMFIKDKFALSINESMLIIISFFV